MICEYNLFWKGQKISRWKHAIALKILWWFRRKVLYLTFSLSPERILLIQRGSERIYFTGASKAKVLNLWFPRRFYVHILDTPTQLYDASLLVFGWRLWFPRSWPVPPPCCSGVAVLLTMMQPTHPFSDLFASQLLSLQPPHLLWKQPFLAWEGLFLVTLEVCVPTADPNQQCDTYQCWHHNIQCWCFSGFDLYTRSGLSPQLWVFLGSGRTQFPHCMGVCREQPVPAAVETDFEAGEVFWFSNRQISNLSPSHWGTEGPEVSLSSTIQAFQFMIHK